MNRRAGLKRVPFRNSRKPLRSYKGLTRHTPMPRAKVRPAVPDDVRAEVAERSGGWCEMARPGCWGRASDPAHRITTKFGGRHGEAKVEHDRLSDVIYACRWCHDWATDNPQAYDLGLALREHQDPSAEHVLLLRYSDEPVYLDDRGGWHTYAEVGT